MASAALVQNDRLYFLMVRANIASETISFKVWDGGLDTVLQTSNELIFVPDQAQGTVDIPYLIDAQNQYTLLIANPDTIMLNEDNATDITVLDNDEYSIDAFQQLIILQAPANGGAQVNTNETITYLPGQDWFGVDSLAYIITNTWYADTAIVIINVSAVNDAPAEFDQLTPTNNTNIMITLDNLNEQLIFSWGAALDVENDPVTYSASFTGSLDILTIPVSLDTMYAFNYSDLLSTISDNGHSTITGTWQIIASDSELERLADNGPHALTIDASSVSTDIDYNGPNDFRLYGNFPNPFNPSTSIQYELPQRTEVKITIYDIVGREVTILVSEFQDAGYKSLQWDASNVPSGMYFYQIRAGEFMQTRKMVLLK